MTDTTKRPMHDGGQDSFFKKSEKGAYLIYVCLFN